MKFIANIVFFKYNNQFGIENTEACIFYSDGTCERVSYEDGIDACEKLTNNFYVNSKKDLETILNNSLIYTMSLEDFEKKYDYFIKKSLGDFSSNYNEEREEESQEEQDINYNLDFEDFSDNNSNHTSGNFSTENPEELENEEESPKKKGLWATIKEKVKNGINKIFGTKYVKRLALFTTAILTSLSMGCGHKLSSKTGVMENPNLATESTDNNYDSEEDISFVGDNSLYDDYSSKELLEVTLRKSQKNAMRKIKNTIKNFNGKFADAHLESDKNIRAALSFDELVALQNAYNDYSKEQIQANFNGTIIDANEMNNDYKSAVLQLMGAHVIETRENPVDMSSLLKTDKEKDFYNSRHEMFLSIKDAPLEQKSQKVKEFLDTVKNDLPITLEVRTEGIMHREDYNAVESYKLSIIPMVAAAEIMYQNLNIDNTLNDLEIDFLNDLGLCNNAQEKFERIEEITSNSFEDIVNPLYTQYRNAIIREMENRDQYVINDEYRDLSRLDAFQNNVNWHFNLSKQPSSAKASTGAATTTTETTNTWTTQTTTYSEETTSENKKIPKKYKKKVDKKIEKENQKEKKDAYEAADKVQDEMQTQADQEAEKVQQEVDKINQDTQDSIDAANDQINENNNDTDTSNDTPVNESDIGIGTEFDDEHSNPNGDLNNSVEDITTDPTNDQTDIELPDPNETGANFDQQSLSYEQYADEIIEALENASQYEDDSITYTYSK